MNKEITSREVDFAKWYTDIVRKADLIDYTNIKGSMIIRPYGYAIWEEMVSILDKMFKETGHENIQMPMFIPESLLNVEKDHVEGFAPEVAWVTHGGDELLEERMCVRPTSEVLFCEHYKKIIKSYRDLPKLYNQWCTIVRWEKTTRPFLRSREILWQEGHTMHLDESEAREETLRMLHVYEDFQKNHLALPVLVGKKTEKEKFAGAIDTYTVEAMMYDGVALQNGTSHYFGDKFAKVFDIEYLDKDGKLTNPHQTSWGVSTRMIGAVIMTHSDDRGLVLPPKIAPIKVNIIPIGNVTDEVNKIIEELNNKNITYHVDNSEKSPGFKFAESEVKGYPIRIEIGERDLANNLVTLVRRDTLEKINVDADVNEIINKCEELLIDIQESLYKRALDRRNSMIHEASTKEEFKTLAKEPGFILTSWCGDESCEEGIKEDYELSSRCIPFKQENIENCIYCNKDGKYKIYFGRQY